MNRQRFLGLLELLQARDYRFRTFDEPAAPGAPHVVLRHDVDLAPAPALEMARWESAMGVRASYFFLVTSGLYNASGRECRDVVRQIADLGHAIGLHFDASSYEAAGPADVRREKAALAVDRLEIVSLHRPPKHPELGLLRQRLGIPTTYDDEWFTGMTYVSDSRGECEWLLSEVERRTDRPDLQLLIHPLWWVAPGATADEKLRHFVAQAAGERHETLCDEVMPTFGSDA